MEKLTAETRSIMEARFGKDSVIALATTKDGVPQVRYVNGLYWNGAFYIITHALSHKMKEINRNPIVAVAGEWFTGHGKGVNLGYFYKAQNHGIAEKLKQAFAAWIGNGHNDFADRNTCILCVQLTDGILFSQGARYAIDFLA